MKATVLAIALDEVVNPMEEPKWMP
jgi:hypothetical protein